MCRHSVEGAAATVALAPVPRVHPDGAARGSVNPSRESRRRSVEDRSDSRSRPVHDLDPAAMAARAQSLHGERGREPALRSPGRIRRRGHGLDVPGPARKPRRHGLSLPRRRRLDHGVRQRGLHAAHGLCARGPAAERPHLLRGAHAPRRSRARPRHDPRGRRAGPALSGRIPPPARRRARALGVGARRRRPRRGRPGCRDRGHRRGHHAARRGRAGAARGRALAAPRRPRRPGPPGMAAMWGTASGGNRIEPST